MSTFLISVLWRAPLVVLSTIVMGTVSLVTSLFDSEGRRQHWVARWWSRMLLSIGGVEVSVEGLEKLSPGGAYVFASNHLSYMDTPVALWHIPVEFRFLAKMGLFQIPFLGWHLRRSGHLAVPRGDARGSLRTMTEAARVIQEKGISMLLFPEGGRTHGRLRSFKEGAAYIAIKARVPAVPVGIVGTRQVLPMGSLTLRPGKVTLRIGQPISTQNLSLKDRHALTLRFRDEVAKLSGLPLDPDSIAGDILNEA